MALERFLTRCAVVLVPLTMVLQPSLAHAQSTETGPWSVGVHVGPRWHLSPTHDAFASAEASASVGLSASLDVVHIARVFTLSVDVAWDWENVSRDLNQSYDSGLVTHDLTAGVTLHWALRPWLLPYLRVAGGTNRWDVTMTPDNGAGSPLVGGGWGAVGSAGLGTAVRVGIWGRVGLDFTVESGVNVTSNPTVVVSPQAPSDATTAADRLTSQPVNLGTLNDTSVYFRVGGALRF